MRENFNEKKEPIKIEDSNRKKKQNVTTLIIMKKKS